VLDLAKTEQVVVCHDKPRAVGARFCQPEHSGARFGKNGGKWQLAVTKQRRWGLFLPNRASKCSIWQKRGQVVVGHDETRAAEFVFAKPSTWMLDLAKTGAGGSWP